MSKVVLTESHLSDIADAIRGKNGQSAQYTPGQMAAAIEDIPTGGGGMTVLTRAQWNALTTAQKQSYGLVGIQDASTGFNRGVLVNGADYLPIGFYLPYSDASKIICEAYTSNFDALSGEWGFGSSPIVLMQGLEPSKSTSENAIYLPCSTYSPACAYVDLGESDTPFTAYVVMKMVSPGTYTRVLSAMNSRSSGQGMMMFGSTINISSWANDTSTGISSADYFVAALQFTMQGSGFGVVRGGSVITKNPQKAGRYITIARTDPDSGSSNAEPGNAYVRYMAVVKEDESQGTVAANLENLAAVFLT